MKIKTIIFDLGGVLINWNPRFVYRSIFNTEEEIDWFFDNICTNDWNENQDAGYPIEKATQELIEKHPDWEDQILAYYGRWEEMLGGEISETVSIFEKLREKNLYKFYALTNWSAETFPVALERFKFLQWFDGRVVSGEEKTRKPFHDFYNILLSRYNIDPSQAIFIDDNKRNVEAAEVLGIKSIHFESPDQLSASLSILGFEV